MVQSTRQSTRQLPTDTCGGLAPAASLAFPALHYAGPDEIELAVRELDWARMESELNDFGYATTGQLLSVTTCRRLAALFQNDDLFRSRVVMGRHGFGRGEYKYFCYPLPETVAAIRRELFSRLAPLANRWNELMGLSTRYPDRLEDFLVRCTAAGQTKPTPLLLRYDTGDYNCLHQDLYGEHVFPLQIAILVSDPAHDFDGGEFVLTEQRPRMQSKVQVVRLSQGEGVIFAVHHRPVQGIRGVYRVNMRHGVSRLRSGQRHTLGVIFHDAA